MPSQEHDAVLHHLLKVGAMFATPAPDTQPYESMRAAMDLLFTAPALDCVRSQPANFGALRGEWILDADCDHARRLLFLHGGGYISGSIDSHRNLAGWISRAAGCAVLLVDYRLAPEHPFPAAVDDALAAFEWMRANAPHGPEQASRCFVLGDSAGGGLALALLLQLRDQRLRQADAAVTFSAWTDVSNSSRSMIANQNSDLGALKSVADYFTSLYVPQGDARQPLASPVYAELHDLPPLLMQVSEWEIVFDDSVRFANRARAAGVRVELDQWPGLVHVWQGYVPLLPEANEAIRRAGNFLRGI
jgi:acetyl esterase/lipase